MSDNSKDCISNYYKQEYKPATSSDVKPSDVCDCDHCKLVTSMIAPTATSSDENFCDGMFRVCRTDGDRDGKGMPDKITISRNSDNQGGVYVKEAATSTDVTISRKCAEAALNSMLCDMEFDEALLYDELKAALEKNDAKS